MIGKLFPELTEEVSQKIEAPIFGSHLSSQIAKWLCLVKTKSTFEINNLKKRDVTMLHAIWLGEITIRHGQVRARFTDLLSNNARSNWKRCHGFGFPINSRSV